MTDLVERLRDSPDYKSQDIDGLMSEAADALEAKDVEIARLKAALGLAYPWMLVAAKAEPEDIEIARKALEGK